MACITLSYSCGDNAVRYMWSWRWVQTTQIPSDCLFTV